MISPLKNILPLSLSRVESGVTPPTPPVNNVPPVISGAANRVGETFTTTDGTWSGTTPITYTYQWRRGGVDIGGATNSTYVIVLADMYKSITCVVTGTNIAGNSSATSNSETINNKHSILLDGISKYINIDSVRTALASTTVGTISLWVKPIDATPVGNTTILAFGDTDADEVIFLVLRTDGTVRFELRKAGVVQFRVTTNAAAFTDNTWSHVAVTAGTTPKIYIGSTLVAQTASISVSLTEWFNNLTGLDNGRIGCANTASAGNYNFLNANYDEILFINRELTQPQISDIYNSGVPKDERAITNGVSMFEIDGDVMSVCTDAIGSNNGTYVNCVQGDIKLDVP